MIVFWIVDLVLSKRHIAYGQIKEIFLEICFLIKNGYRVELVSPVSADSVVSGLLKKYKNTPYHICYEAEDPEGACQELTSSGFIAIDTPTPAPALGGRRVVFLTSPVIGMVELIY